MKRGKYFEALVLPPSRVTMVQTLMLVLVLYFLLMSFEIPLLFKSTSGNEHLMQLDTLSFPRPLQLERQLIEEGGVHTMLSAPRPQTSNRGAAMVKKQKPKGFLSDILFNETVFDSVATENEFSLIRKAAKQASLVGVQLWDELESGASDPDQRRNSRILNATSRCPNSIAVNESEFYSMNRVVELPCGMTLGTGVTVIGKPRWPHSDNKPMISLLKEGEVAVMVSQFFIELQGLQTVEGEDPPRILHFNPRLKGDWSGKPAIEQNTCYRMQWGNPLRCEGWSSRADEETVDGQLKCESWLRDDSSNVEESKAAWWLKRLIRRKRKTSYSWPFPFSEGKLFVLSLRAGMEGYHIYVDGRHITSFPYRTGFALEDATGVTLNGDVDLVSIVATSLPDAHPSFAPQQHLEHLSKWQAPELSNDGVELFIGILSSGNHFAERMAVRKTWMQHALIKSSIVVARFFVALSARKEINIELKQEAEYFGDIIIVPYMDHYDLVVLKTVAICEYGLRAVDANYIMKCDDDTFVRVDAVIKEAKRVSKDKSVYVGNINYYHKPLRTGKWAVTYEEWSEEEYPPYANGPGYILSSDIAKFIIDEFERSKLGLFKMEDVSMGMWVQKFNRSKPVEYVHSLKFCQFGCIADYYTAHYQSPRQMICLWEKLHQGRPQCCNMR